MSDTIFATYKINNECNLEDVSKMFTNFIGQKKRLVVTKQAKGSCVVTKLIDGGVGTITCVMEKLDYLSEFFDCSTPTTPIRAVYAYDSQSFGIILRFTDRVKRVYIVDKDAIKAHMIAITKVIALYSDTMPLISYSTTRTASA